MEEEKKLILSDELVVTRGRIKMELKLLGGSDVFLRTTISGIRPKSRKEKKFLERNPQFYKRVGRGTYTSSQSCVFDMLILAKMASFLHKDENGKVRFLISEEGENLNA